MKDALRHDRPGSSALAAALIGKGQKDCLPEALQRAIKAIARPAADDTDLLSAIRLVFVEGSEQQIREYAAITAIMKEKNPG